MHGIPDFLLEPLEAVSPLVRGGEGQNAAELQCMGGGDQKPCYKTDQKGVNRPNIDWQDKIHRGILPGLINISEAP